MALCPHCNKHLLSLDMEEVPLKAGTTSWTGVVCAYPWCGKALSAGIDPVELGKKLSEALRS